MLTLSPRGARRWLADCLPPPLPRGRVSLARRIVRARLCALSAIERQLVHSIDEWPLVDSTGGSREQVAVVVVVVVVVVEESLRFSWLR